MDACGQPVELDGLLREGLVFLETSPSLRCQTIMWIRMRFLVADNTAIEKRRFYERNFWNCVE